MAKKTSPPAVKKDGLSFIHKHVPHFVSWVMVVAASLATIPAIMSAQIIDATTSPSYSAQPPVSQQFDPKSCIEQNCDPQNKSCFEAAGNDETAVSNCQQNYQQCMSKCQTYASQPSSPPMPPQTDGEQICIQQNCVSLKEKCNVAGIEPTAQQQCFQEVQRCVSACGQNQPRSTVQSQPYYGGQGGQPGGFGGPGEPDGFGGPQDFDEEQMKRQAEMQKEGLKRMKKDMGRFGKHVARIKIRIATVQKNGTMPPSELVAAVAQAEELLKKINAAESFEEIEDLDIPSTMSSIDEAFREHLPNLERLANLKKIYLRIDRQIKKFDRQLVYVRSLVKKSKIDLNAAVADFDKALTSLKSTYAAAQTKIAAGDIEAGFDVLEEEVFDSFGDVAQYYEAIQQIRRLQPTITQISRDISRYRTQVNRLKKTKNADVTQALALLDQASAKLVELKTAAAAKPFVAAAVFDILESISDFRDEFIDELNDLKGVTAQNDIDTGFVNQFKNVEVPDFSSFFESPQGGPRGAPSSLGVPQGGSGPSDFGGPPGDLNP